jgi:hypothetical protein
MNTQEKDNEIYGEGNSYSAEYWQYDARLGRRWNVDPKDVPSFSPYSCFANNPLWFSDVAGDSAVDSKLISAPDGTSRLIGSTVTQTEDKQYLITPQNNVQKWNNEAGLYINESVLANTKGENTQNPTSTNSLSSKFIPPISSLKNQLNNIDLTQSSGLKDMGSGLETGGFALSQSKATFRLYRMQGTQFSPKLYTNGWGGGSAGQIRTFGIGGIGNMIGFTGGAITTGFAYNEIFNGSPNKMTYVDATVGTVGLGATVSSSFLGYSVPVVGQAVGVYSLWRGAWELGKTNGPSKWYGTDNNKWFK